MAVFFFFVAGALERAGVFFDARFERLSGR